MVPSARSLSPASFLKLDAGDPSSPCADRRDSRLGRGEQCRAIGTQATFKAEPVS